MTKQVFEKGVGVVAGGNVYQSGNVFHMTQPGLEPKPLLEAQREHLSKLVKEILNLKTGIKGWEIWKAVHREVGAESVEEMNTTQYPNAAACLERLLEEHSEGIQCRRMVARVLTLTKASEATRQQAVAFALDNFGTSLFRDLNKQQLRELLGELSTNEAEPEHRAGQCNHDCTTCRAQTLSLHETQIARTKVAANNDLQSIRQAADAKYKALEREFKARAVRLRQWILAAGVAGIAAGIALGTWAF